jgi:hypothetical protein
MRYRPKLTLILKGQKTKVIYRKISREICVCSLYTDNMKDTASLIEKHNKKYCDIKDYDFICHHGSLDSLRHPTWSKILLIQQLITKYKWIFWIDADAVFNNVNIRIEDRIDVNFDLIVCYDRHKRKFPINAGVMLFRNSVWSTNFLSNVYRYPNNIKAYEQGAIIQEWRKNDNKSHVKILSWKLMNSKGANNNYNPEDFILHFGGAQKCKKYIYRYFKNE